MTPLAVNPNGLPSQFRDNARDTCATDRHPRSMQHVVSLDYRVQHMQTAIKEICYALDALRGNGPQREQEKLIAANVKSMAPLADKANAAVVTLRKEVEAEQAADKMAVGRSISNSNTRSHQAIKVRSDVQFAFDEAVAGRVKEKAPEVRKPKRSELQTAFAKASNDNKEVKVVRPVGLNSQQVENSQPRPVPRPSPSWAAEVDAKIHYQSMRADDARAMDRNDYLDAIAAGLAERREVSSGFNRGAEQNQHAGKNREIGR